VSRHSAGIIGLWVLLAAAAIGFAAQLPNVLGDHGLMTNGAYSAVQRLLSSRFDLPEEPVVLLFENRRMGAEAEFRAFIARTLMRVDRISGVDVARNPLRQQGMVKGRYAFALVSVPGSMEEKKRAIELIRRVGSDDPAFAIAATGKPVVQDEVNRSSKQDLKTAETIGVPVAFALLAFTFGGMGAALIPIAAGVVSVVIAMAIVYGIGATGVMELSVFVYNVIPMTGMAVCLDFALFMVSRYREERARRSAWETLHVTVATSGRTVIVSACCVMMALIGTFAIRMPIFNSVALGALTVIAVSAMINLTLVPALLFRLDPHPKSRRRPVEPEDPRKQHPFWRVWTSIVLRRPIVSAISALAALTFCLIPVSAIRLDIPGPESLPRTNEARMAAEIFASDFGPRERSTVYLVSESRSRIHEERMMRELRQDPRVHRIAESRSAGWDDTMLLTLWVRGQGDSAETLGWVREIEQRWSGVALVGGEAKYEQEVRDEIFNRVKYVLGFALLSNFAIIAAAFRSLLLPLKAVAMNLASIGASFGILVWICQAGRFGMDATDIAIMIPVFIYGLTFGISMDYGIFLLSRIYESYKRTNDNASAIQEGMSVSGRIITSAAAIMIAVTVPFALADVAGVRQLGIGIAAALFIDATLVRSVLVPSIMKIAGEWNWWLPFARR